MAEVAVEVVAEAPAPLDSGTPPPEPAIARAMLEAVLFASDKPLTLAQLAEATALPPALAKESLEALKAARADASSGIEVADLGGAFSLRTKAARAPEVRRLLQVKPFRLTRAALETLSIVAYRQPITRPEVEDIRGVDCGAVMKALLDRRLVRILGKKDDVGRPLLYGTSREFLELFHLKDLASLPTLREFHELSEEHRRIVEGPEAEAPPAMPEGAEGLVAALTDARFEERLKEAAAESDSALEALEVAMKQADTMTKAAAEVLGPLPGTEQPQGDGAPLPATPETDAKS